MRNSSITKVNNLKTTNHPIISSILKKANDGSDGREATLHVQVKSWSGAREGTTVATTGTLLHVQLYLLCVASLFRLFQLSLWQQLAFHNGPTSTYKPSSTATHHPHRTIIHNHSCITSSVVTKTSIFLPPSCYLLGAGCLSGASSAPSPSDEGLTGSTE